MIKEVIIVEGKSDIARLHTAVEADVIATEGFTLRPEIVESIRHAYEKRGIIILTDPDGAGERIRKYLAKRFPDAMHAFVPKSEATANNDVGIEEASPESIRKALDKVHPCHMEPSRLFGSEDMRRAAMTGTPDAAARRARMGALLGIGYGNGKQFLSRLNHYGITRKEWDDALIEIDRETE